MLLAKSPLSAWMGGKYQLSRKITPLIPEHKCYVEPFAGAAWVLFRKAPSEVEVLNDLNRDIVTLCRVLQHHLEEFVRYFKWVLVSRDEFERWLRVEPATLTDIQRATRFYYVQKLCFGGRIVNPSFGTATTQAPRLNLLRVEEELSAAHLRLARVYVENLPYQNLIARYDRPTTFFYIDPPYWGCEDDYGKALFDRQDFARLAAQLRGIQGGFILSLNDVPEAEIAFQEALQTYRELAQQNPATYQPDLANTLNNLGTLYHATQRPAEAETAFLEALQTYRELAQRNPTAYRPYVAMTLNNLGVLYCAAQRLAKAETAFQEALRAYRALAQQNPAVYQSDLAKTLNNLRVLYRVTQQLARRTRPIRKRCRRTAHWPGRTPPCTGLI